MYATLNGLHDFDPEKLRLLKTLRLRYFTPREVANLLGFPSTFGKFDILCVNSNRCEIMCT